MRFLALLLCISPLLFAYQKGDTLSPDIQQKLSIKSDITVVDFFASWCVSCKKEIPYLSKLHDAIDKQKIEIVGVDADEDLQKGQNFQKELARANQLRFRVIDDPKNEIIKAFNPIGMPAVFIVKEGKVASMIVGAKDNIDTLILEEIKGLQ